MADEYQLGCGNWWNSSRIRLERGSTPSSTPLNSIPSFGWPTEIVDIKARSSMDSTSVSGSSTVFQDSQNLQGPDSAGGGVLGDPNLQIIGLGLSSQGMEWNQTLFRGEKAESSYHSMLEENMNADFQQAKGMNEFKQINQGLTLDQPQYSPNITSSDSTITCQGIPIMHGSPSTMVQGLFVSDNHEQQPNFESKSMNYSNPSSYGINAGEVISNWPKYPQFLRVSPPKQPPHGLLHFSNNAPFWNTSTASMNDVRSRFLPSLQTQFPRTTFDETLKNTSEIQDLGTVTKKSSSETSNKRTRNETPSPLPVFKVRKEKMGDRISALQQVVSPFGKTDTASVLSETIEYIKFLHEQVSILSTPYMKSGATIDHRENSNRSKEGPKQNLKSRGLCLIPISSTFPVSHDQTTVDSWNPAFGGTFR